MNDGKAEGEPRTRRRREMAALSKIYLILYNGAQTAGWSYILCQTLKLLAERKDISEIWSLCGPTLTIFQSLAFIEVLHSIIGLVPASALVTFLQVFSRVFQVWGILNPVKEAQNTPALVLTLITWGITETIRYSYYCCNTVTTPPKFLTWCRYTFFLILYPAGVIAETGNVYYALNVIKYNKLFSLALPNRLNFSFNFYYATLLQMLAYFPLFPKLYIHMFHQRKKILGGLPTAPTKKLD